MYMENVYILLHTESKENEHVELGFRAMITVDNVSLVFVDTGLIESRSAHASSTSIAHSSSGRPPLDIITLFLPFSSLTLAFP